eukprot:jgi/Chlat1/6277/Chrsp44S05864
MQLCSAIAAQCASACSAAAPAAGAAVTGRRAERGTGRCPAAIPQARTAFSGAKLRLRKHHATVTVQRRPLDVVAAVAPAAAATSTLLSAIQEHTQVVPDTFALDDFARYRPEAGIVSSRTVLQASCDGPQWGGVVQSALSYAECQLEESREDMFSCFEDKLFVNFGAEIAAKVSGRVSTEVDPVSVRDTAKCVARGKRIAQLYSDMGVEKDKYLLKIPATWEGIQAAKQLEAEGIQCHMTLVYSLVQAAACAQAGCSVIQPMVGRTDDWSQRSGGKLGVGIQLAKDVYNYCKKFGKDCKIMVASLRNVEQVMELVGVDYLVVSPKLLDMLSSSPSKPLPRKLSLQNAKDSGMKEMKVDEKQFAAHMKEDNLAQELLNAGMKTYNEDHERLVQDLAKMYPAANN